MDSKPIPMFTPDMPRPSKLSPTLTPSSFIFDDEGARLIITHDDQLITGKVSPNAMALASPVWKNFFYPPWRSERARHNILEGTPATKKLHYSEPATAEVDFREDNAPALLILLQITHLQLAKVPTQLVFEVFFGIAVLCDKYDCVHLVKPWLSGWYLNFESSESDLISHTDISGLLELLFVHWVFGKETEFRIVSKRILLDFEPPMMLKDTMTKQNQLLLGSIWPSGIEATILPARSKVIEQILGRVRTCLTRFSKKRGALCKFKKDECDAIMYGSVIQGFEACNVYSTIDALPSANSVTKSISQLSTKLTSIRMYTLDERGRKHVSCERVVDLKSIFHIDDSDIPFLVQDSHVRHMEIQRKKLSGEM